MTNLLSRLQGLTAPDREVDAEIFQLLGGSDWDEAYMRAQEPCGCPHELAVSTARERYSPRYTASLDATVALCERVLPGKWQYVVESATRTWYLSRPNATVFDLCRELLIAILTALEGRDGTI